MMAFYNLRLHIKVMDKQNLFIKHLKHKKVRNNGKVKGKDNINVALI